MTIRVWSKTNMCLVSNQRTNFLSLFNTDIKSSKSGFPSGPVVKNPPASAEDTGSIADPGRSYRPWSN